MAVSLKLGEAFVELRTSSEQAQQPVDDALYGNLRYLKKNTGKVRFFKDGVRYGAVVQGSEDLTIRQIAYEIANHFGVMVQYMKTDGVLFDGDQHWERDTEEEVPQNIREFIERSLDPVRGEGYEKNWKVAVPGSTTAPKILDQIHKVQAERVVAARDKDI